MNRLHRTLAIANRRRQFFMSKKKYNSDVELEKELINDGFVKQDVYEPALAQSGVKSPTLLKESQENECSDTPLDFSLE